MTAKKNRIGLRGAPNQRSAVRGDVAIASVKDEKATTRQISMSRQVSYDKTSLSVYPIAASIQPIIFFINRSL
jgi:hypothetical protein